MTEWEKFRELEEKIKNLINEKVSLKQQIQILEEALKNKETELVGLQSRLKILDEERNNVRARVDSLLELLADIELAK